ncbi:MAG: DNA internalization-related competence protein ComEC/Rec2 [Erysipelotrichales bacterium]|nr:DNA internalization-related competence protein ComEC/Rec2 [Erysipelotrichales bacterium]
MTLIISYFRVNIDKPSCYDANETEFTGLLTNYKIDGDKFSFELKAKEKLKGTYYIKTEEEKEYLSSIDLGITLKLKGTLSVPLKNTIPNTFNYKKYLNLNGINYTIIVDNYEIINNEVSLLYKIKNFINKHISKYKSKAYLQTFIVGNKEYLDDEVMTNYQTLGVSHIFAISGMHVSLLSALIIQILKKIKVSERNAYIFVIIFLIFYMFITNFQASILRSVGLFILLFINRELDFNIEVINILYLDITILLIINPYLLYNIGFLYSSVVSFSLIKYSKLIKGNYLMKILKVSLIAFLFSLPITISTNYELNILSVLNNIVIVPVVSLFLYPLSLLTFILPPLDNILYLVTSLLEIISNRLLVLNVIIPKVSIIFILFYYSFIILFYKSYNKFFLVLTVGLIFITKYINYLDSSYYVYFLDVGQGDSIVIKKGNECIMIDTGGKITYTQDEWKKKKEYFYTDNTIKFLKSIGIYDVDYLILSHGDQDHGGEANHLIENFKVKNVLLNKGELNNLEKKIPSNLINATYKGKMNISFLDTGKLYDNENDNSQINLLNAYNYKFLFLGDASQTVEEDLLKKYKLNVDVMKLGHHGSKTSSGASFIKGVNPKYSIISVGRNNRYRHPNKETLENVKNTIIYRTDEDGTISFKINKTKLKIETYSP